MCQVLFWVLQLQRWLRGRWFEHSALSRLVEKVCRRRWLLKAKKEQASWESPGGLCCSSAFPWHLEQIVFVNNKTKGGYHESAQHMSDNIHQAWHLFVTMACVTHEAQAAGEFKPGLSDFRTPVCSHFQILALGRALCLEFGSGQ